MRIINKCFGLLFCLLISCRANVNEITAEVTTYKPPVEVSYNESKENCADCPNYRLIDTVENGRAVTIIYYGNTKSKKFKNEVWNYRNGVLVNKIKDTIIENVRLFSKEEINGDETVITNFEKNNPKKEYESIYKFKKGKKVFQISVSVDEKGNVIEQKKGFDEKGELITRLQREHRAFQYPKDNQNNEITEYYKFGKKHQWSKLTYIESKSNSELQITRLETLSYYNLKNELIKKEFLKDISGTVSEVFSGQDVKIVQKIELLKTEYYKRGKLVKTLVNDKGR
nr:hypothetical protein [uncultured Flavobacterium sp.]